MNRAVLMRVQSDERLVAFTRAGHDAAFEAIVLRYRQPLLRYVRRLLGDERAEDAVQQALLNAHVAMRAGGGPLELRPWLFRIAHNVALNALRERGWNHEPIDERIDGVERPEQVYERRERLREVLRAVQALPERQRDALLLRELHGLSHDEIARALGVADGAARQLIHRGRSALRSAAAVIAAPALVLRFAREAKAQVVHHGAGASLARSAAKLGATVAVAGVLAGGALPARSDGGAAPDRRAAAAPSPGALHEESRPQRPARRVARTITGQGKRHGRMPRAARDGESRRARPRVRRPAPVTSAALGPPVVSGGARRRPRAAAPVQAPRRERDTDERRDPGSDDQENLVRPEPAPEEHDRVSPEPDEEPRDDGSEAVEPAGEPDDGADVAPDSSGDAQKTDGDGSTGS